MGFNYNFDDNNDVTITGICSDDDIPRTKLSILSLIREFKSLNELDNPNEDEETILNFLEGFMEIIEGEQDDR